MLTLYSNGAQYPIQNDDYYVRHLSSGLDEVVFSISIWDELYPMLTEEAQIRDRDQQWYLIKQIDGGKDTAKIVAQLDLDAWKASMFVGYSNGSATLNSTITGILPAGWSLLDQANLNIQRTIEGDYTPIGIVDACRDTYGVYFLFNNVTQTITAILPDNAEPLGAFATRDLNLKEINYKGKSNDLVTRLYAYGSEGLSFASINNNLPYIENFTYTDKIISAVWRDDRYTAAENLLTDAKRNLAAMAVPSRSYDCDVVDLRATNPELYGFQNFDVFSVATLIDDATNTSINYQVVERWEYPYYPEKNKVIFSSSPAKIQSQVTHITQQVENPNSSFRQQQQIAMDNATNWITGAKGGYVVFQRNAQGQPSEILIMDTPDISTATQVWRWNQGGLGYSSTGYNGPYTTAITQDGAIVADFITVGTLTANLIKAGILQSVNNVTALNMDNGRLTFSLDGNSQLEIWTGGITFSNSENHLGSFYVTEGGQSVVKADQFVLSDNDQAIDQMQLLPTGKTQISIDNLLVSNIISKTGSPISVSTLETSSGYSLVNSSGDEIGSFYQTSQEESFLNTDGMNATTINANRVLATSVVTQNISAQSGNITLNSLIETGSGYSIVNSSGQEVGSFYITADNNAVLFANLITGRGENIQLGSVVETSSGYSIVTASGQEVGSFYLTSDNESYLNADNVNAGSLYVNGRRYTPTTITDASGESYTVLAR